MPVQNYENLDVNSDVTTTRTLLHEVIPLTGTIASGTYNENNILNYTHGMFQSVYDYPYLSSSANHIFDLTSYYLFYYQMFFGFYHSFLHSHLYLDLPLPLTFLQFFFWIYFLIPYHFHRQGCF